MIREEEPPKPSTRLSTADTLATIAANRGTRAGEADASWCAASWTGS